MGYTSNRPAGVDSEPARINSAMRQWADDHVEDYARSKLGDPSPRHSTRHTLRWRRNGSFSLELTGSKRGFWNDRDPEDGLPAGGGNSIALIGRFERLSEEGVARFIGDRMGTDYKPDPAKIEARRKKAKAERAAEKAEKLEKASQIISEVVPLAGTH